MATAGNIVDSAFKKCGVRLPTSGERTSALTTLNDLLALWSAERLLVYFVVEEPFTLVVGTNVYTIGSAGTFNTGRPAKITAAYLRDSDNIDYPLDVTMALKYSPGMTRVVASRSAKDARGFHEKTLKVYVLSEGESKWILPKGNSGA